MVELCGAQHESRVLSYYACGDSLPIYARYVGETDNNATVNEALIVYVSCQRENGHAGKHLALTYGSWEA